MWWFFGEESSADVKLYWAVFPTVVRYSWSSRSSARRAETRKLISNHISGMCLNQNKIKKFNNDKNKTEPLTCRPDPCFSGIDSFREYLEGLPFSGFHCIEVPAWITCTPWWEWVLDKDKSPTAIGSRYHDDFWHMNAQKTTDGTSEFWIFFLRVSFLFLWQIKFMFL